MCSSDLSKKGGKGKKAVVESSDEVEVDEIVEPTAKVKQVNIISQCIMICTSLLSKTELALLYIRLCR